MRIDFNITQTERGKFRTACEAVIRSVGTATKAGTTYAAWDIMSESISQVPVDTGTLLSSAYFGVSRRDDISGYRYGAVLGYGTPEGLAAGTGLGAIEWLREPSNGINPKNGHQASTYAAKVHEDLDMPHPRGGKAKFLEDPIRNWASGRFSRTMMSYWKNVIEYYNVRVMSTKYIKTADLDSIFEKHGKVTPHMLNEYIERYGFKTYSGINWSRNPRAYTRVMMPENMKVSRTAFRRGKTATQRGGKYVNKGQD